MPALLRRGFRGLTAVSYLTATFALELLGVSLGAVPCKKRGWLPAPLFLPDRGKTA